MSSKCQCTASSTSTRALSTRCKNVNLVEKSVKGVEHERWSIYLSRECSLLFLQRFRGHPFSSYVPCLQRYQATFPPELLEVISSPYTSKPPLHFRPV